MTDRPSRIVHNTSRVGPGSTGVGQVALNLANAQAALGCDVRVWCGSSVADVRWAHASSGLQEGQIERFSVQGPSRLGYSRSMMRAAATAGRDVAIVHQHGIWTYASRVTREFHKRHGIPYVVAPHGSLEGWGLRRSRWKKAIALAVYERANLSHASCLHATGESEIRDFRDFGLRNPIALIPNGVSERWLDSQGVAGRFRERYGIPHDRRILLFLSRVTPKKNLPGLVRAVNAIRNELSDWMLVIAGTDEFSHQAEVERLVDDLGLRPLIRFIGPLFDQPKRDGFAATDLLVLPSYSEGSPMVVLDSLAAGVPVITTTATPWKDLVTYSCGWWTDVSDAALASTLSEATQRSREELSRMGQAGRSLVASRYTWTAIAREATELYEWLLGRGPMPVTVVTG